jgi:hypothetical protein
VEELQAALGDAQAARDSAIAQFKAVRQQTLAQQHRQLQGSAGLHRVAAEAEAAKADAEEMRRVGVRAGMWVAERLLAGWVPQRQRQPEPAAATSPLRHLFGTQCRCARC